MSTILKSNYVSCERPMSQTELKEMRERMFRKLKLSKVKAEHRRCGHIYHVKFRGKKETEIKESNNSDCGKCSICWKLSKSTPEEREIVNGILNDYYNGLNDEYLTHYFVELERVLYTWLYIEK